MHADDYTADCVGQLRGAEANLAVYSGWGSGEGERAIKAIGQRADISTQPRSYRDRIRQWHSKMNSQNSISKVGRDVCCMLYVFH